MSKKTLEILVVGWLASLVGAQVVLAGLLTETELTGTMTNNTFGTAQAIPDAAFTLPPPSTVFNPPGWATATISGTGGNNDVDFFSFSTGGGGALFDIDGAGFDTILTLFDSSGTLIAFDDDTFPTDSGSNSGLNSLLGTINLAAGDYRLAISRYSNFASAINSGTLSYSSLTRPDGEFGGYQVSGATTGNSSFPASGVDAGSSYLLHVSLASPVAASTVPEPASLTLLGLGALGLVGHSYRRRKRQPTSTVGA